MLFLLKYRVQATCIQTWITAGNVCNLIFVSQKLVSLTWKASGIPPRCIKSSKLVVGFSETTGLWWFPVVSEHAGILEELWSEMWTLLCRSGVHQLQCTGVHREALKISSIWWLVDKNLCHWELLLNYSCRRGLSSKLRVPWYPEKNNSASRQLGDTIVRFRSFTEVENEISLSASAAIVNLPPTSELRRTTMQSERSIVGLMLRRWACVPEKDGVSTSINSFIWDNQGGQHLRPCDPPITMTLWWLSEPPRTTKIS